MQDAHRAYRRLEEKIVLLELAPGATTTEAALIEATGLGRTPTREAVQRLALEGFLEIRPRSGLRVADLVSNDWTKVIDAREGLERVLAEAASMRQQAPETRAGFEAASEAMREASDKGDVRAFLAADKSWDEVMADASGNPFAARGVSPLQTHSRRFWYRYAGRDGLAGATRRHLAIIQAVLRGDAASAISATGALMDMLRSEARKIPPGNENAPQRGASHHLEDLETIA